MRGNLLLKLLSYLTCGKEFTWVIVFDFGILSQIYFSGYSDEYWRRKWQHTPGLFSGKFHGQRSLVGYNQWGREESMQLSNFTFTFHFQALGKEMATHSIILSWRIPGTEEPGGLPPMGLHRVGHVWNDLAVAAGMSMKHIEMRLLFLNSYWTVFMFSFLPFLGLI